MIRTKMQKSHEHGIFDGTEVSKEEEFPGEKLTGEK